MNFRLFFIFFKKLVDKAKTYEYNYPIDLSYIEAIDYLYKNPLDIKNENDALVYIGNTIKRFSEKNANLFQAYHRPRCPLCISFYYIFSFIFII